MSLRDGLTIWGLTEIAGMTDIINTEFGERDTFKKYSDINKKALNRGPFY